MKQFYTLALALIATLGSFAQTPMMVANQEIKTGYESFVFNLDEARSEERL